MFHDQNLVGPPKRHLMKLFLRLTSVFKKILTLVLSRNLHPPAGTAEVRGCVDNVGWMRCKLGSHVLEWSDLHPLVTAVRCGCPDKTCLLPHQLVPGLLSVSTA